MTMTHDPTSPFVPTAHGFSPGLRMVRPPADGVGVDVVDKQLARLQALRDARGEATKRKDAAEKALRDAPERDESAHVLAIKRGQPDPGRSHEEAAKLELDAAKREVAACERAAKEQQQDCVIAVYSHRHEIAQAHEKTIAKARTVALAAISDLIGALELLAEEDGIVRWAEDPRQPFKASKPTISLGNRESMDAISALRTLTHSVSGEAVDRI